MERLLECVPNFSEGRNKEVISQIAQAIRGVKGAWLLEVDPGKAANRSVMTIVGKPEDVVEAAFQAIAVAASLIDMSCHEGVHPRMGATDVCPLIPVRGISWEEAQRLARNLGKRVGEELGIPVYLYEKSASHPGRTNLANIRKGEYEGFKEKISHPAWKPDFGPATFNEKNGQTVIGVRDFLIAYNINLNSGDPKQAHQIAKDIRESGRIIKDEAGMPKRIPGACKGVKALGWYIEEYGMAQVSTNITDRHASPVHRVFEACRQSAALRGLEVGGSELVGLIPKDVLLDAGLFYLSKEALSTEIPKYDILEKGVKSLGLHQLRPFNIEEKVLEYAMEKAGN